MSQSITESTNGQMCADGRAQEQSVGADVVVGNTAVLLSSLEALNTEQKQMTSCNMGNEVNSDPAFRAARGSSNDRTKFERLDGRVSLIQCIALFVSTF